MLKKLIICALVLITLPSCVKHKQIKQASTQLIPQEGLVSEPIFDEQVYIKLSGNPSGEVIVLVHGLGDNASRLWAQTIRKLESRYFLLTLDLPGFGKSPKSNALYSPENYAKLIHHLTQAYINKPFHLVGHSMGGAISLRYAAMFPGDIDTLTLVDAAGILHRLAYTQYLAPLGLKPFEKYFEFSRKDVSSLAGYLLNKVENLMHLDPSLLIEDPKLRASILRGNPAVISGMALVLDDFSQLPSKISAPTQIIWGESDEVAPLRTGHVLNTLIPHARLSIVAGVGHNPITQKPAEFHRLLLQGIEHRLPSDDTQTTASPRQQTLSCNHQNNLRYTGSITKLSINHCKNVIIQDATIEQLFITDSRVFLNNVNIHSSQTALTITRSSAEITAGSLAGLIAIQANESRLDIAGTQLSGKDAIMMASTPSSAVFSLSSKTKGLYQPTALHGRIFVTPDTPLL